MSAALYNAEILRLATSIPHHSRLSAPQGSAELRSPVCGSRVAVDVVLNDQRRIAELGMEVRSCALGQASAALMGAEAMGLSLEEMEAATARLRAMLTSGGDAGFWPGMAALERARDFPARHAAILLPFEALLSAMQAAQSRVTP